MKRVLMLILSVLILIGTVQCLNFDAAADNGKTLYGYILDELEDFNERVDISYYVKKNNWDLDDVRLQVKYFYLSEPALFYVDREVIVYYSSDFSEVELGFQFLYSKEKTTEMKKAMKKAALKAVADITDDMTTAEKALWVHDYIILNCSYDSAEKNYSAYDCLVKKSAVCQGYSLAYTYIMRDILGIDCTIVFTDSQNHAWNYVKIGKKWYHVDLTADDPTYTAFKGSDFDAMGEVKHENLLLSDDAFYASSPMHRDWDTMGKPAASSKKYDNYFWIGSTSAMYKINGLWYYSELDESSPGANYSPGGETDIYTKIRTYDIQNKKYRTVKRIKSTWTLYRDPQTGKKLNTKTWYTQSYLKLAKIGDKLYFNTASDIYRLTPESGKIKKVYSLKKGGMQIYSIVPNGKNGIRIIYKRDFTYSNNYIKIKIS